MGVVGLEGVFWAAEEGADVGGVVEAGEEVGVVSYFEGEVVLYVFEGEDCFIP